MSGKYFHCVPYGVNDDGLIDYDQVRSIALECKPKMIVAGASAYARTIDFKKFREIADEVGAILMVDTYRRACCSGDPSEPVPARGCRDNDDSQDAARSERRYDSLQSGGG
jgi:glycine hydroxymethyltransferase